MSGDTSCDQEAKPVGQKSLDFVIQALDTNKTKHVVVKPSATTQWNDIKQIWPGKFPHVLVHINAGNADSNGVFFKTILDSTLYRRIGVVLIGDDAFPCFPYSIFQDLTSMPHSNGDPDTAWILLSNKKETAFKYSMNLNSTMYPGLNGIISNTLESILHDSLLLYKSKKRCDIKFSKISFSNPNKFYTLGFKQGYYHTFPQSIYGQSLEFPSIEVVLDSAFIHLNSGLGVIIRIQSTILLSFQPQHIANQEAASQIVYDAVMYSSWERIIYDTSPNQTINKTIDLQKTHKVKQNSSFVLNGKRVHSKNSDKKISRLTIKK